MEESNIKAMREALENIAEYAKAAACHTEDAHLLGYLNQIAMWAEDALSAPPRNCDRISDAVVQSLRDKKLEMAGEIAAKEAEIEKLKKENACLRVMNCGQYYSECNLREEILRLRALVEGTSQCR